MFQTVQFTITFLRTKEIDAGIPKLKKYNCNNGSNKFKLIFDQ